MSADLTVMPYRIGRWEPGRIYSHDVVGLTTVILIGAAVGAAVSHVAIVVWIRCEQAKRGQV